MTARKPRTLTRRIREATGGKVPRRCSIKTRAPRSENKLSVPRELRGMVNLLGQLAKKRDTMPRRKATFDDMEHVHIVESLLKDALRRGGHCPRNATLVMFYRRFMFSAR